MSPKAWRYLSGRQEQPTARTPSAPTTFNQSAEINLIEATARTCWKTFRVTSDLLEHVVHREPLETDGKSGSRLERCWLENGLVVIVKHSDVAHDWIMQATRDDGRIARLWNEGLFEQLETTIEHGLLDVQRTLTGSVVVMKDLSASLFSDGAQLRPAHKRVLVGAAEIHRLFTGQAFGGLCPLRDLYAFLSPVVCARFAEDHEVPRLALAGWERFHDIVSDDVAAAIGSIHADPTSLADALLARESTLVHGDLKLANLGADAHRVVILDWGTLTTWAPAAVDFAWYVAINAAALGVDHDQLLYDVRLAAGHHDETALGLALLGVLAQLGWEKALGATSDDIGTREREEIGLAWWIAQARRSLHKWSP